MRNDDVEVGPYCVLSPQHGCQYRWSGACQLFTWAYTSRKKHAKGLRNLASELMLWCVRRWEGVTKLPPTTKHAFARARTVNLWYCIGIDDPVKRGRMGLVWRCSRCRNERGNHVVYSEDYGHYNSAHPPSTSSVPPKEASRNTMVFAARRIPSPR